MLMHEMGHLFGLPEAAAPESTHDVMWETLGLSTRREPDAADALAAGALAPSATIASQPRLAPLDAIFQRLGARGGDGRRVGGAARSRPSRLISHSRTTGNELGADYLDKARDGGAKTPSY